MFMGGALGLIALVGALVVIGGVIFIVSALTGKEDPPPQ